MSRKSLFNKVRPLHVETESSNHLINKFEPTINLYDTMKIQKNQ